MWLFYNRFCNQALPKEPDFCSLPLGPPHPLGSATRHPWALSARGHLPQSFFLSILFLSILFPSSLFCLLQSCLIHLLCLCQSDCLQCFPILQSPYWVPFSPLQCFFFAIYVTLSFPLCLTLFLSFFFLLFLFLLLLHLLVLLHISLNLSASISPVFLCLCLVSLSSSHYILICLSLYLPHLCLSLSLEEDCWMDKLTPIHQPTCPPSWRSVEGGGHCTGQS